jgi:HrpA-like RNA helicase
MESFGTAKHHNGHSHHGQKQKHSKLASSDQPHSGKRKRAHQSNASSQQLPEDVASLPVYAHKQEVLQALRTHSTLVVVGETGSGKSTQLPKIIFQAGMGSVVCTQVRLTEG